jgi:hypothetical protein
MMDLRTARLVRTPEASLHTAACVDLARSPLLAGTAGASEIAWMQAGPKRCGHVLGALLAVTI